MRFKGDPKYKSISMYVFITGAALMLLWNVLQSFDNISLAFLNMLRFIASVLSPFMIGIVLAYLLSPGVRLIERLLRRFVKDITPLKSWRVSSSIAIGLTLAALTFFFMDMLPRVYQNVVDLVNRLPGYMRSIQQFYTTQIVQHPLFNDPSVRGIVEDNMGRIIAWINTSGSEWFVRALSGMLGFFKGVFNAALGGLIAFYILWDAPHMAGIIRNNLQKLIGVKRSSQTMVLLQDMDNVFGRYLSAKFVEALAVGLICYIGLLVLGIPYSALWAVVLALFNMIPYFGPWISTAFVVAITFVENPAQALSVLIFIMAVQTIDGFILVPRIFGQRMDLSPIWVLFGVIVGGATFGFIGMLLGVPVVALIKVLLSRLARIRRVREQRSRGAAASAARQDKQ